MNKENQSRLVTLLEKVANERNLEIYDLNIKTNQNPIKNHKNLERIGSPENLEKSGFGNHPLSGLGVDPAYKEKSAKDPAKENFSKPIVVSSEASGALIRPLGSQGTCQKESQEGAKP